MRGQSHHWPDFLLLPSVRKALIIIITTIMTAAIAVSVKVLANSLRCDHLEKIALKELTMLSGRIGQVLTGSRV